MFVLVACAPSAPNFKTTDISKVDWGGDVVLTAHTGAPFDTASLRGKAVVLFFGYTHCPDICTPTLVKLAEARRRLGAIADDVQVVFISVDPAHDTPQQLAAFLPQFDRGFIGLTGSDAQIAKVASDYKIAYRGRVDRSSVDHSGNIFIKDRAGKLRLLAPETVAIDDLVHDLKLLLS